MICLSYPTSNNKYSRKYQCLGGTTSSNAFARLRTDSDTEILFDAPLSDSPASTLVIGRGRMALTNIGTNLSHYQVHKDGYVLNNDAINDKKGADYLS